MKNATHIIGRKAFVDFPTLGIEQIPAKIDTGADSSAIWASDIQEENGILSFILFDKSSSFYTGQELTTKDYKIISVKNSFGKTEFRYKVKIIATLHGRDINVRFTLADRSNSSQPILIGRRTLQGKFIVDVSVDPSKEKKRRVLFMSTKQSVNVKKMTQAIQKQLGDVRIDIATYDDLIFSFKNDNATVRIETMRRDLADYDIVHFKTSIQRDVTAALARYASNKGVRVLDDIVQYFPTTSKLYEYSVLNTEEIAIPDTIFVSPLRLVGSYELLKSSLDVPFVLKGIHTSKGQLNEVIRSESDFNRVAELALEENQYLVGQKFIPNDGDYRVLVFGKQIGLVILRSRVDDTTHLNNTSSGGSAKLVETTDLPAKVQIDSIRASVAMGRDITGVDMVQDNLTGEWYCFEVNDGPQLATGVFIKEKREVLADYLRRELEK